MDRDELIANNPHLTPDDLNWLAESYGLATAAQQKTRKPQTDMALVLYLRIETLAPHLLTGLEREYHFAEAIGRRFRFDLAWTDKRLAVEVDGKVYTAGASGGRHLTAGDYEKLNAAVELGWRVLRYLSEQVKNDPMSIIEQIERMLK
jgi:very-short-patch-repair endonuclease